ncbi:NAD-dependent epimerase/dehydratase family protein [Candidatus Dependentiae bacterium]|nr:NAD-dependent epimerase/dehydratase family protein [Candidatus Dependentiae bacterium]
MHNAWKWGVKKFLAISSACVFSPDVSVFKEDLIHDGSPHSTQFAYAAAKRNIDIQIHAYKKQHLIQNYCSIILGNAFGKSDNYQLNSAYLIPSLIHKIFVAKKSDQPLKVWGDGAPKREFIYADDVAKILFKILELDFIPERILVAGERQITIKEIAQRLCKAADFKQEILWETDKPQGPATRCSDLSLLQSLVGSITYTQIDDALRESYQWFEKNYEHARK